MSFEPFETPTNYKYSAVNTFHLMFLGEYVKLPNAPKTAFIKVKVQLSDGSRAKLRMKTQLVMSEDPDTEEPKPASRSEQDSNAK